LSWKKSLEILLFIVILIIVIDIGFQLYQYYSLSRNLSVEGLRLHGVEGKEYILGIPTKLILRLGIIVRNPTSYTLYVEQLSYSVFIEGKLLYNGVKRSIMVPAESNTTLGFDLEITASDVVAMLWNVLRKGSLQYRVNGTIQIPIKLFNTIKIFGISVPYDVQGTLTVSGP